jgi:hypothetical protein
MRFLSIAFVALAIFSPLSAHSQTGCVRGVVVDYLGQPIKGMQVGLAEQTFDGGQQPAGQAVTDETGAFEIDDIPSGEYGLGAQNYAMGYPGKAKFRQVSIIAAAPCTSITYNAGARMAKLKFTVTDAVTNKSVPDLYVDISAAGQANSRLPVGDMVRSGIAEPRVPSLAKMHLELTASGYSPAEMNLPALKPGEMREIVAKMSPESLGCITGIAVDDRFAPVKGATIAAAFLGDTFTGNPAPVLTDDEGRFKADRLKPGDYNLYPEKDSDGFSRLWVGWLDQPELPKILKVTVPATGACKNVTVNMGARGAWLNVTAIDGATQEHLSAIVVTVLNSEHSRQGGSDVLREPRQMLVPSHAKFTVRVRAQGYLVSEPIQLGPLVPDEKKELTVPLQRETPAAQAISSPAPGSGD